MSLTVVEEPGERRHVLTRKVLVYTPLALAFGAGAAVALYYAFTNSLGALVGAAIFGLPAFAFAYEAVTALRDLRARPTTTRGTIARMWNKGTVLWMTRAFYMLVDLPPAQGKDPKQRFFVISQVAYLQLEEGRTVEIEHWPHTNTIVRLGLVESSRPARSRN
ncbi:MAG: hypothetical protein EXR66_05855 [Dehalococcoidia bacterium]|nr:hypothetical protein [Dehalococcoidia bacterium]